MTWSGVEVKWTPTNEANPYIGEAEVKSVEKEIRFEFYCDKSNLLNVIKYIKDIRSYERAEIDIIPIMLN